MRSHDSSCSALQTLESTITQDTGAMIPVGRIDVFDVRLLSTHQQCSRQGKRTEFSESYNTLDSVYHQDALCPIASLARRRSL